MTFAHCNLSKGHCDCKFFEHELSIGTFKGLAVCVGRLLAELDRLGRGPAEGAGVSSEGLRGPLATLRRIANAARSEGAEDDFLCSTFLLTSSASVRAAARGDGGLAEELRRLGAAAARGLDQWARNPRTRFVEGHLPASPRAGKGKDV